MDDDTDELSEDPREALVAQNTENIRSFTMITLSKPKLRVLEEIGNAESREGKVIQKLFEGLLRPLPLAGEEHRPEVLTDALELEFPWMGDLIASIRRDLLLRRSVGTPWLRLRPKLLIGPRRG